MSTRFVSVDRNTPLLLPPDLRDWVPDDDLAHFVLEAVEGMKLEGLKVNHRGTGSEQYPPRMMLGLLIYCYANGIFSSRRIERATYRDIGVRYLSGDTHPDHDTIAVFRRRNFDLVAECFVKVLELARELKLLKVGTVSVDGTHIRANASKHRNVTYERAGELRAQLDADVHELLRKAEEADEAQEADTQQLPEELHRRRALKQKMEKARETLEKRAEARAAAEQDEYERKVRAREQRKGSSKGKIIQPPNDKPEPHEQVNLSDEDSRLMRKSKRSGYEQCFNAQAVVDAEGSQLVLGARVSTCASDRNELVEDIETIPDPLGKPTEVLADSGYACEEQVNRLATEGMDVYVSAGAEAHHNHRQYDLRPEHLRSESRKEPKAPWLIAMKEKVNGEYGRSRYRLRKQTVEPVFGIIKDAMGFRRFHLRGTGKVEGEWELVTLAYNMKRLWNLKMEATA